MFTVPYTTEFIPLAKKLLKMGADPEYKCTLKGQGRKSHTHNDAVNFIAHIEHVFKGWPDEERAWKDMVAEFMRAPIPASRPGPRPAPRHSPRGLGVDTRGTFGQPYEPHAMTQLLDMMHSMKATMESMKMELIEIKKENRDLREDNRLMWRRMDELDDLYKMRPASVASVDSMDYA